MTIELHTFIYEFHNFFNKHTTIGSWFGFFFCLCFLVFTVLNNIPMNTLAWIAVPGFNDLLCGKQDLVILGEKILE